MFLDSTYFQGDLYLPNLKIQSGTAGVAAMLQAVGENTLEWYVDRYEREFLDRLLGQKLARAFVDGMRQEKPEARWSALKERIYRKERFSYSPAANYVFYWLSRRGRTQTSIHGEVRATEDHSRIVPDGNKLARAWNDLIPQVKQIRQYLSDNWSLYQADADEWTCICRERFLPINTFNL